MKDYIKILEEEFSNITNGFKDIEKRAKADFETNNKESMAKLAELSYKSDGYQVRMYSVFLFGYLSEDKLILKFMEEEFQMMIIGECKRY